MYNRYTQQPDGSFKRRIHSQPSLSPGKDAADSPPPAEAPREVLRTPSAAGFAPQRRCPPPGKSAAGFLKDLLPKDLDTGDLLIIVLLLLISSDSCDDHCSALLTLAIYLLM